MKKAVLQFSHGNSYPAGCYRQLLRPLEKKFQINAVEMFGHNKNYPVTDGWTYLVEELIDSIETYADAPVYGVGHSLGGVLTFIAAVKRPDLFKSVVMLDSPVFSRLKSMLIKWIKQLGLIDKITPGGGRTLSRKRHWPDAETALQYLRGKTVFKNFTEECLKDYITFGMEITPSGLQLKYDVDIEHEIYKTIPHDLAQIKKQLRVPLVMLYGNNSDVVRNYDVKNMQHSFSQIEIHKMPGGHLFPFEHPKGTAELLLKILS